MNFYIASSLGRRERVSELIKLLETKGYNCTMDWTKCVMNEDDPEDERRSQLQAELEAIRQADFVIGLPPLGRGAHGEIGAAAILGIRTYYLGEVDKSCLLYEAFKFVPDVQTLIRILPPAQSKS